MGVGHKIAQRLTFMGVHSALDLANLSPALARNTFNVEVERTIRELNGQVCKCWDTARADKKQIFSTRSAGQRIIDLESLTQALCQHANIASMKTRRQGSLCRVMMCFASSSPFDGGQQVIRRAVHHFTHPTSDVSFIKKR